MTVISVILILIGMVQSIRLWNEASGNLSGSDFGSILSGFLLMGLSLLIAGSLAFIIPALLGIFLDVIAIKKIYQGRGKNYIFLYSLIRLVLSIISIVRKENVGSRTITIIIFVFLAYTAFLSYMYRKNLANQE